MKFISHLDMTRFMSRLIAKSKIPVWYTEGFNQHIYMNFAVPLSLGFEGNYEIVDIKITDDSFSNSDCLNALRSVSVEDIDFFDVQTPTSDMKEIAFAEYELAFNNIDITQLTDFLNRDSIICLKKGKKGRFKEIDIVPKIKGFEINDNILKLILVAGNEDNLNPSLVMSAFFESAGLKPSFYSVIRTAILNSKLELFK